MYACMHDISCLFRKEDNIYFSNFRNNKSLKIICAKTHKEVYKKHKILNWRPGRLCKKLNILIATIIITEIV